MRKWATVLHVQLHADGSLMDVQVAVPSGSPLLDQIAVSAVQQAQPFPAPSPDLVKRTGMTTSLSKRLDQLFRHGSGHGGSSRPLVNAAAAYAAR